MTDAVDRPAGAPGLRLAALAFATVFVLCAFAAVAFAWKRAILFDFLSYWGAARLTLAGYAPFAYDIARLQPIEDAVAPRGFLPFPYPPPFLLFTAAFGLAPFWLALAAWVGVTSSLYCLAARQWIAIRFAIGQAAAAANFITGQNGFLTSAIFIRGTSWIATRPLLGGATLGLLVIKPQLAILLPVALIAGREWRAIAGGMLSTMTLLALGLLLFGMDSYRGFLAILPHYSHWMSQGRWPWGELASPFALMRYFGVPQVAALVVHGAIAAGGAVVTARSWMRTDERRVPVLAAATLLIPPYLFTYDGLLLTLPLAWLIRSGVRTSTVAALWVLTLLPAVGYVTSFPNTIPIAAMLALWLLHRQPRTDAVRPVTA